MNTHTAKAFGTEADLKQMNIERREVTPKDVEIGIVYCGLQCGWIRLAQN